MPLSDIAKKITKKEVKTISNPNIVFGVPEKQFPSLQGTMQSTTKETAVTPAELKMPTVAPTPIKPTTEQIAAYDKAQGVTISTGKTDKAVPPGRKLPIIGPILFGRGESKLYEKDTIAGTVEKAGVIGFLTEGWMKFTQPTSAQVGDRIYESYDKFVQEGIPEDRALDAAIQNVVNKTHGAAINIQDFKNLPETKLTDEEKDIVFWINARDDLFAFLDAPVFVGSTKIAKEGATELVERVAPIRDNLIKRLEKGGATGVETTAGTRVKNILEFDEDVKRREDYIEFLKDTPDPSINQLNEGLEILRASGGEYEDIASELVAITQDVAKEPAKYIQDPKTGKMMGSRTQALDGFVDTGDVTVSSITDLEGRGIVSKQYISDNIKRPTVKQAERDIVLDVLSEYDDGAKINVKEFADKVKARILKLDIEDVTEGPMGDARYINIALPDEVRGNVFNYSERIYNSPVKTSAGQVHFGGDAPNYFAHTRIEDLGDVNAAYGTGEGSIGGTRRVIELQSDLFQKGRFTDEAIKAETDDIRGGITRESEIAYDKRVADLERLEPYRNTWWERVIREEVRKAAEDGKTLLQFPTGETAMKIEGLGAADVWRTPGTTRPLKAKDLSVGMLVNRQGADVLDNWVITEVLDDGKFKAVNDLSVQNDYNAYQFIRKKGLDDDGRFPDLNEIKSVASEEDWNDFLKYLSKSNVSEQFDISGKVDTNNPIYKFYEKDVAKYLAKKYGATKVVDENGVSWIQMAVNKEAATRPVEAFAGGVTGIEEDENGNIKVDPLKATLGIAAAGFLGLNFNKFKARSRNRNIASQGVDANRLVQPVRQEETSQAIEMGGEYLSSSHLSDSLVKGYADEAGQSIVDIEKAINPVTMNPRKATPEQMSMYGKFREFVDNKWTNAVQFFQDDMVKVLNLVNNPNVKVTDDTNPWLAELLFHGRIGGRMQTARDTFINIDKDIVTTAKKNGVPDVDMTTLVNKFLHSRHAPERNARLGDGAAGITNAEASAIQAEISALPYGKEVERIANQVQAMNNETLDILLEAQVIDKEAYDAMRSAYTNHVPLQRILTEDQDVVQALTGRGFDVKSTGIKRAKGSEREVADIITNVVTNYEQALIRAEKNRVDLTTLAFARDNTELKLFEEIKPKAIGRGFDKPGDLSPMARAELSDRPMPEALESVSNELRTKIEDAWGSVYSEMMMSEAGARKAVVFENELGTIDRIESKRSTFPSWVPENLRDSKLFDKVMGMHSAGKVPRGNAIREKELLSAMEDRVLTYLPLDAQDEIALSYLARESETLASVYEKVQGARGRIIYEQITDPRVLVMRENGKPVFLKIKNEDLAMALKGVSRHQVPSYMKGVQAFTRFYSGLQTRFNPEFAFPNKIRDLQEAVVYAGSRGELGFTGGIKGALDQKAYVDVLDHIRGVDSEGARLYQQMIDDGGTTGGMSLSTREAVELDIAEIRRLNRSNPRQAANKVIRAIDDFNTIFEDSTRLSLYKQALKRGVSRKKAAQLAKEASVNFNKFGRGGPVVNAMWMFSNASIQGTTKMIRAMKDPKVAAAVSTSVMAGVYASGQWNDSIDEEWRDKISEWDRINSLVVVLPSASENEFNYVTIPVGWGIKPIKVSAEYLYDASVGKGSTAEEAFNGIGAAMINAYNPVGGTDLLSAVTPTIIDIPSEIARNKAWHGGQIKPDWDLREAHLQYFSSLTDNSTGQIAVEVSSGLSGLGIELSPADIYYAYQGYIGGAGRTVTDTVNTLMAVGRGEMPPVNDIPVYSRFVKNRPVEEIGAGTNEHERVRELQIQEDTENAALSFAAEDSIKRLQSLETEEAAKLFDEIAAKDEKLAKKISDVLKEQSLGLTYTQRNLKNLTVESRANYIYDKLESLGSDEERAALWDEYTEKKIISEAVAEEINNIRNGTNGQDKRPSYEDGQTTTQRSFIDTIKVYAEAIGTDPVTAFNRMITGQRIRRIDGGAIIVDRMPFEASQAVRAEQGATDELRLDHTIPLQLGGSNGEDNLKLVSYADWERYTAVENMLGEALRAEKIDAKFAQQLIIDFKSGKLTSQQVKDAIDNQ